MRNVSILLLSAVLSLMLLLPAQAADDIVVGYQLIFNPWKAAIARGDFEKETKQDITWRKFDSPGKVLPALASGRVHIALIGSTGVTTAMTQDLGIELFWITEAIEDAEALVVRDGSGIVAPQDLKGKKLGVPFVSTTHFHTLFALEQFGIDPKDVEILNMPPNAIAAAWERGDIDAAFVWDPALSRIKKTGKVLITSGQLGKWGKPTFDGMVVNKEFAAKHPDFMVEFVKTIAKIDAEYRDNAAAWTADSKPVKDIVSLVGGNPADVPGVLSMYGFPDLEEQTSCAWMGCGAEGGAARALKATAEFLLKEKKIDKAKDDYSKYVNPSFAEKALEKYGNF
jgi:taurine transport system substrate-binding protein